MGQISAEIATTKIEKCAIGVGEAHDNPKGKDLIMQWIEASLVENLIVELGPYDENVSANEEFLAFLNFFKDKKNYAGYLSKFILAALEKSNNNINVYAWDPGDHDPVKGKKIKFGQRNEIVTQKFVKKFGQADAVAAPKTVLLFGSSHFSTVDPTFSDLITNLDWVLAC